MTTSVLDRAQMLRQLSDEQLFSMYDEYPSPTGSNGYSGAAKLHLAKNVAALRMELKLRNLIP